MSERISIRLALYHIAFYLWVSLPAGMGSPPSVPWRKPSPSAKESR